VVKLETIIPQEKVEELMRRHIESLLIESRKGHHISFRMRGEHSTQHALSSTADINPCFMSFCRWLSVMVEGV
jgi:hypothetical protein